MEKEVIFKKVGNRPDTGHFESGDRKAFPPHIADELVVGRVAEYAPSPVKKAQTVKTGKEA